MKYISHLDMMRLFQRALKRADIKLQYSQGFSPHPKMSIAQPLTLGYTSMGEYIELETVMEFSQEELKEKLEHVMPDGISILSCSLLSHTKKAIGALVNYATYEIYIMLTDASCEELEKFQTAIKVAVKKFQSTSHILVEKTQKKTGKTVNVDIKELVRSFDIKEQGDRGIILEAVIHTGSQSHLNPDLLVNSFIPYLPVTTENYKIKVTRKEMYTQNESGELISLSELV